MAELRSPTRTFCAAEVEQKVNGIAKMLWSMLLPAYAFRAGLGYVMLTTWSTDGISKEGVLAATADVSMMLVETPAVVFVSGPRASVRSSMRSPSDSSPNGSELDIFARLPPVRMM